MISERADVLERLSADPVWATFEGAVALASEGFCPRCGHELRRARATDPYPAGWCAPCGRGWRLIVTLWSDARHVELEQFDRADRPVGSHGWVDHQ